MRFWTEDMERPDALLYGTVTYQMMEEAWRRPVSRTWPDWMTEWEIPFAEATDRAPKQVVSNTLTAVDWNAELVRGAGAGVSGIEGAIGAGADLGSRDSSAGVG